MRLKICELGDGQKYLRWTERNYISFREDEDEERFESNSVIMGGFPTFSSYTPEEVQDMIIEIMQQHRPKNGVKSIVKSFCLHSTFPLNSEILFDWFVDLGIVPYVVHEFCPDFDKVNTVKPFQFQK